MAARLDFWNRFYDDFNADMDPVYGYSVIAFIYIALILIIYSDCFHNKAVERVFVW